MVGKMLSHCRLVERIGGGGMGEVYRAHDERLGRDVAVKVLLASTLGDEAARRRFRKEARSLSKLNHPNIATVFDFNTQDGVDFLVMEYVDGETLGAKIGNGPLPEAEITRLGLQLAAGLAAAHRQHVVHRDQKPGNVRITPEGLLKILDFGLAKNVKPPSDVSVTETMTGAQSMVGTLPYMSPEQLRGGAIDARSDIWAAGAVLFEMATARRAFAASLPGGSGKRARQRHASSCRGVSSAMTPTPSTLDGESLEVPDWHLKQRPPAPCGVDVPLPSPTE